MTVISASLEAVAVRPGQYPPAGPPEIAFAGRSNVGKSSLINCLLGRKKLARTSSSPGKTRTINFYNADGRLRLVDLPGYGYAKASKSEAEKWGPMIESYLLNRKSLKGAFLLVDSRRRPAENDRLMSDWLAHYGIPFIVIAAKRDKLPASQSSAIAREIEAALGIRPVMFSSETKAGKDEVWGEITRLISE
jgi:GTP-binding protein